MAFHVISKSFRKFQTVCRKLHMFPVELRAVIVGGRFKSVPWRLRDFHEVSKRFYGLHGYQVSLRRKSVRLILEVFQSV